MTLSLSWSRAASSSTAAWMAHNRVLISSCSAWHHQAGIGLLVNLTVRGCRTSVLHGERGPSGHPPNTYRM
jgi:hypothetical protein